MKRFFSCVSVSVITGLMIAAGASAASYDGYRWFQIEVSIFTNDYPEYRDAELWSPQQLQLGYPARSREFSQLTDFLQLRHVGQSLPEGSTVAEPGSGPLTSMEQADSEELQPAPVGPFPYEQPAAIRLPDMERDPFLLLPASQSDFQTTNARLGSSPANRLLFHGVWRQPVVQAEDAEPLIVRGGRQYGQHHELEGTITLRFNASEDRVVIDANLWLTEFTGGFAATVSPTPWELPPQPGSDEAPESAFRIQRIVQMQQSRPMRSTEFHYLDHPALGLVVMVLPYDLPPPPAQINSAPLLDDSR